MLKVLLGKRNIERRLQLPEWAFSIIQCHINSEYFLQHLKFPLSFSVLSTEKQKFYLKEKYEFWFGQTFRGLFVINFDSSFFILYIIIMHIPILGFVWFLFVCETSLLSDTSQWYCIIDHYEDNIIEIIKSINVISHWHVLFLKNTRTIYNYY